ncbi:hypothetical protein PM082_009555 [Marasmius tenuissimus]|nr:hypothetical protein PM082_009555 [Marasmius tenuissimus]
MTPKLADLSPTLKIIPQSLLCRVAQNAFRNAHPAPEKLHHLRGAKRRLMADNMRCRDEYMPRRSRDCSKSFTSERPTPLRWFWRTLFPLPSLPPSIVTCLRWLPSLPFAIPFLELSNS